MARRSSANAARKEGKFGEKYPGQEYVARVKVGTTAEPVRATFVGPKVATWLIGNAFAGTEVRTGNGVGEAITDRVPIIMLTRRGREARFAVVLEPLPKGQPRQTREVVVEQADGETVVTIHQDKNEERLALDAGGKVRCKAAGGSWFGGKWRRDGASLAECSSVIPGRNGPEGAFSYGFRDGTDRGSPNE